MRQILIIDDDKSIRSILSMFLKEFGYDVKTAASGEEGIELFKRIADLDLVITDIRMPGIDGNEVAKIIRNSEKSELPLVHWSL
jgi:CheY-like chemotaxis protein